MTARLTWIKFFPSDWLNGTVTLDVVERGVYITLLALIYDRQGPIENNTKALSRRCGMTPKAFSDTLESLLEQGKLFIENGVILNEKAEKILADTKMRSVHASKGGIAKAQKKSQSNQQNEPAQAETEQPDSNAQTVQEQQSSSAILDARSQIEDKKASKLAQKVRGKEPEPSPDATLEADLRHAAGWHHDAPRLAHVQPIAELIAEGLSLHDDVIPIVRQLAPAAKTQTSWLFFVGPLGDALRRKKGAPKPPRESDEPKAPNASTVRSVVVWRDSPQGEAWRAYRAQPWPWRELVPPDGGQRRMGSYFPSEWPPGRDPNPTAKEA